MIGSFDLFQHVSESTHVGGHILDLELSRPVDNALVYCFVSDLTTDHYAVHWCITAHRPLRQTKLVSFRKFNDIDYYTFSTDVAYLLLVALPAVIFNDAVLPYNFHLADVLDLHAPLVCRTLNGRLDNSWDDEKISTRREVWRREWQANRTGLTIDKQILIQSIRDFKGLVKRTKTAFPGVCFGSDTLHTIQHAYARHSWVFWARWQLLYWWYSPLDKLLSCFTLQPE